MDERRKGGAVMKRDLKEENLSRYVCGGWMCSNDDWHYARQEDRELCAEYCELGKVWKRFDEELVRILGVLGDE